VTPVADDTPTGPVSQAADCNALRRFHGCACVDHGCSGGYCPGSGCTAKETLDCGAYGCGCVDHKCSGGIGCSAQGTGCTAKETTDCSNQGCGCADHQCTGGSCAAAPGSACSDQNSKTARRWLRVGRRVQRRRVPRHRLHRSAD
jgi:hypothetical protein